MVLLTGCRVHGHRCAHAITPTRCSLSQAQSPLHRPALELLGLPGLATVLCHSHLPCPVFWTLNLHVLQCGVAGMCLPRRTHSVYLEVGALNRLSRPPLGAPLQHTIPTVLLLAACCPSLSRPHRVPRCRKKASLALSPQYKAWFPEILRNVCSKADSRTQAGNSARTNSPSSA